MADNRKYEWKDAGIIMRPEYDYIEKWVARGAKVIDLGCGNGSLMKILRDRKNADCRGIDISPGGVEICREAGFAAERGPIDEKFTRFTDGEFDYAIMNVTLQMLGYPEIALAEMRRIARKQIISFPNFAFLSQRLELMFLGRMPRRLLYGYDWFETGHIHQFSIKDFQKTARTMGFVIIDAVYLVGKHKPPILPFPNITATEAIFLLEGK